MSFPKVLQDSVYKVHLSKEDIKRYNNKIRVQTKDGKTIMLPDPYKLGEDEWDEKSTQWPVIEYPHIYAYFIERPGLYTVQELRNYRSLSSYNFVTANKVGSVFTHVIKEQPTHVFLRAKVQHSQSINNPDLDVWIKMHTDGTVETAHCTCKAGYVNRYSMKKVIKQILFQCVFFMLYSFGLLLPYPLPTRPKGGGGGGLGHAHKMISLA